jgi:hypothetical protein
MTINIASLLEHMILYSISLNKDFTELLIISDIKYSQDISVSNMISLREYMIASNTPLLVNTLINYGLNVNTCLNVKCKCSRSSTPGVRIPTCIRKINLVINDYMDFAKNMEFNNIHLIKCLASTIEMVDFLIENGAEITLRDLCIIDDIHKPYNKSKVLLLGNFRDKGYLDKCSKYFSYRSDPIFMYVDRLHINTHENRRIRGNTLMATRKELFEVMKELFP